MLQLTVQSLENDSTDAWLKPSFWRLNQNQSLYAEQDLDLLEMCQCAKEGPDP